MARKKKQISFIERIKTQTRSTLSSGLFALLLIILAFLALNNFTQNDNSKKEQSDQKQEQKTPETKLESGKTSPVQKHTVTPGENLSKIAERYYGNKDNWTLLASENKITNPDLLYVGTNLTIPDLNKQTSGITTQGEGTEVEPKTYNVVAGDTLWEISQQFYNGDGFQWYRIRDANPDKISLLINGRPRIEPGAVLIIPNLN